MRIVIKYQISTQYTDTPGLRYRSQGNFSGEDFREVVLIPLLNQAKEKNDTIEINLDGTYGYPTSFLEEAFGGLVREYKDPSIRNYFSFICTDEPGLINEIEDDFSRALERK